MRTIEEYMAMAGQAIAEIGYPQSPAGLYEPVRYGLSQGGKRLRPVILLAACDAVGGDCSAFLKQAAAIEMFHNFTLLHDDVMDKAELRRGKPTVCSKWDGNTAILSGDAMLTMATQLAVAGLPAEKAVRLLEIFNRTAMEVYEGQQYDMEFESRGDVSIEEYISMIRLKTSVLLGGACRIGAELGDADAVQSEALYDFAVNLGLAFQLQDDYLDVYGDPSVFGKAIGGDILNNKKTFLLINALMLAEGDERKELDRWLNAEASSAEEKIAAVTAVYDRLEIGRICLERIGECNRIALEWLAKAGLGADASAFFEAFDAMVMGRNK